MGPSASAVSNHGSGGAEWGVEFRKELFRLRVISDRKALVCRMPA